MNPLKNSGPRKSLSAEARAWWRKLAAEYSIQDEAGKLILQTAMEAFDTMRTAQAQIAKDGRTFRDRFNQIRAHPLLPVERDSRAAMLAALKQLNLDLEPLNERAGRPGGR